MVDTHASWVGYVQSWHKCVILCAAAMPPSTWSGDSHTLRLQNNNSQGWQKSRFTLALFVCGTRAYILCQPLYGVKHRLELIWVWIFSSFQRLHKLLLVSIAITPDCHDLTVPKPRSQEACHLSRMPCQCLCPVRIISFYYSFHSPLFP